MAAHQKRPPAGLIYIEDHTDVDGRTVPGIASRLGISPSTYRKWRMRGEGPTTFRLGKRVAARVADMNSYVDGLAQAAADAAPSPEMRPPELRRTAAA